MTGRTLTAEFREVHRSSQSRQRDRTEGRVWFEKGGTLAGQGHDPAGDFDPVLFRVPTARMKAGRKREFRRVRWPLSRWVSRLPPSQSVGVLIPLGLVPLAMTKPAMPVGAKW